MHLYMHPSVDIISRGSLTQGTSTITDLPLTRSRPINTHFLKISFDDDGVC